jgi:hypothetical protein
MSESSGYDAHHSLAGKKGVSYFRCLNIEDSAGGTMKIKQVKGQTFIDAFARKRLESLVFLGTESARASLQRTFPHHVVSERAGLLQIANRDRSFVIAEFKQVP